jgi:hypothetical protein
MKSAAPLLIVVVVVLLFVPVIVSSGTPGAAVPPVVPRSAALGLPTPTSELPVPTDAPAPTEIWPGLASNGPVMGSFTMDLSANTFNQDEADNVRWSLVRRTSEGAALYDIWDKTTNWQGVRQMNKAGSITMLQGKVWSFNSIFRAGVGYKRASGILAGGHCALASALKAAADNAGLPTEFDKKHSPPIPGFSAEDSVTILWGGSSERDLRVLNDTGRDLQFVWSIQGDTLKIDVAQAPSDITGRAEIVHVSLYWPPWGGPNCWLYVDEYCQSGMKSGERWEDWLYKAAACPKEWPFGTKVRFVDQGVEFECQDQGGKIKYDGMGMAWVDTLTDYQVVAWGSNTLVELIFPE